MSRSCTAFCRISICVRHAIAAHSCGERHPSDITIADLWGAEKLCPEKDDDTGLSLVMANTQKGRQALEALGAKLNIFPLSGLEEMARGNPGLLAPAKPHEKRAGVLQTVSDARL